MLFFKPKTLDDFFVNVPAEQKQALLEFREQAAYKSIMIENVPWRYRVYGNGEKTMVLLPGGFTLSDIWMNTAKAFSGEYRLLMPDAYARQECYRTEQVSQAILAMLNEERVDKAVFYGLAAGGEIAQYFLHNHPDRVSHLILSHCDILGDTASADIVRMNRTLRFYRQSPEGSIRNMMLRQLAKKIPKGSEWFNYTLAYYSDSIQGLKKKMVIEYIKQSHAMREGFEFLAARIRNWDGQVLFLATEDDQLTLASLTPLKKFYPKAKIHRFEEGQNHVHLLYPQQVNSIIKDFLEIADAKVEEKE